MEHIANTGGLLISGLMCSEYRDKAQTIKEIIEENE